MDANVNDEIGFVGHLVDKARKAQNSICSYSQQDVDALTTAVAWAVVRPDRSQSLARLAVEESGYGHLGDKVHRIRSRVTGLLADLADVRTVGVVEEDKSRGLVKIAKPAGVIAALIPATAAETMPVLKAMAALKGRNAIIFTAHPRTRKTVTLAVQFIREACERIGVSGDLVQIIKLPSWTRTRELMRQSDLVVATGGEDTVRAVYSCGTPGYGFGGGNAVHVVDETAELEDAADAVCAAKTFDYATSCLADSAIVIHEAVYRRFLDLLVERGGHLCDASEKQKLQAVLWPHPDDHRPAVELIALPANRIAQLAGINISSGRAFFLVEEDGVGPDSPFSGEKLCVALAVYRYAGGIENALLRVNQITSYQGKGHTCGIHSRSTEHVMKIAHGCRTARVLVNQNLNEAAGGEGNGLPHSVGAGCGTWGGTRPPRILMRAI